MYGMRGKREEKKRRREEEVKIEVTGHKSGRPRLLSPQRVLDRASLPRVFQGHSRPRLSLSAEALHLKAYCRVLS